MKIERTKFFKSAMAMGVACLIFLTPITSQAWASGGHMMIAYIAYKRLNSNARAKSDELLAIPIDPANVSKKTKDFINASHWADDLREFSEFDSYKALHFIDRPFSTDGTKVPEVPSPNTIDALDDNVRILKTSTDKSAQARALRLIIHLVGDIHQPLHCSTRVDKAHPEGDRGGNLVSFVVPDQFGKPQRTNLHSYWDGGLGLFPKTGVNFAPPTVREVSLAAVKAVSANPDTDSAVKLDEPYDYKGWAEESFRLAETQVYKGLVNDKSPSLTYRTESAKIAQQRVVWAGYRLAALLNAIWPPPRKPRKSNR